MKDIATTALLLLLALTILTGLIYPLIVTLLGVALFPGAAGGSMVVHNGQTIGSALVAQKFVRDTYFWSRPSAIGYEPVPSGGSNFGPTSAMLRDSVVARRREFITRNHLPVSTIVPAEMCSASGSGIDPHISPAAARAQIDRVAEARGFTKDARDQLAGMVERYVEPPQWGILGNERVNVLLLNIAVDSLSARVRY
jgi:K+-transporting ATPase ATPase C chain